MTTIGKVFYHLDDVDSTNNFAAKLIQDQICQNGAVIMSDSQSAGKGQFGHHWESNRSENLLCSLVWQPDNLSVEEQVKISWLTALAVQKTLNRYGVAASIKWPNDIYVQGKKIAGILIENQVQGNRVKWIIAGIGVNINQLEFQVPNAISLQQVLAAKIQVKSFLNELISVFNGYLGNWNQVQKTIKEDFESMLYLRGIKANFKDQQGVFSGVIKGVSNDGKLIIQSEEEEKVYDLKEVQFLGN